MDLLAGLVVFVLIQLLILQWRFAVLGVVDPEPTAGEVIGYWITAALLLGVLVLGFLVARSQRRIPAILIYPVVGVIALGTVLLLAIPQISLPAETRPPLNPNGCYRTDSENCQGG